MTEEENYRFYYRLPSDRLQRFLTFGWVAIWHGQQYTKTIDVDLMNRPENLIGNIREALSSLKESLNATYEAIEKNPPEQGTFEADYFDYIEKKDWVHFAKNQKDLLEHLANNKVAPAVFKYALLC